MSLECGLRIEACNATEEKVATPSFEGEQSFAAETNQVVVASRSGRKRQGGRRATPRRADEETRDVGRLRHEVDQLAEELSCVIDQLRLEREEYRLLREEHHRARLAKGERRPEGASLRYAAASRSPEATDFAVDV